jgi:hypothetical protein
VDAIRLLVRADLRHRWGSLLALALTTALIVGAVLAATAGARRTNTVFDRYLEATNSSTMMVGLFHPPIADDDALTLDLLDQLRGLDGVEVARAESFMPLDAGTEYDFGIATPYGERGTTDRPVVVEGRLPADDEVSTVAINEIAADQLGLEIGDRLHGSTFSDETAAAFWSRSDGGEEPAPFTPDGPVVDAEVVGIVRGTSDLSPTGSENPIAIASPAFRDHHTDASRFGIFFYLQTDPSAFDPVEAFEVVAEPTPTGGRPLSGRVEPFGGDVDSEFGPIRTAYRSIAIGLVLFAAISMVTGGIVIAFVIARQLQLGRQQLDAATALGMPARDLRIASLAPVSAALVAGVALGTLIAFVASPLFPYSVARRAETATGLRFDPLVNLGLAVVILLVLLVLAVGVGASSTRPQSRRRSTITHLAVLRSRLSPPISDGCSAVLWGASRRSTIRPWTAVAGAVIGVAGIVAIGVFESSRTTVSADPTRFGQPWDLQPDTEGVADPLALVELLAADERVDGVGGVFCDLVDLGNEMTQICAFNTFKGPIAPSMLAGRAPTSPTEIALGRGTLDRLGLAIGDTMSVPDLDGTATDVTVVGTVANPDVGDSMGPGDGVVVSVEGMERLVGPIFERPSSALVLTVPDHLDLRATATALGQDHEIEISAYAFAEPPNALVQLGRMRSSLIALAVFLGGLGVLGLIHYLVLSSRRRRQHLAVLRALGFVRSQVCGSTMTQAVTVALCGLLLGMPLGLIVGRWAWLYSVADIGIDDSPVVPWPALAAIVGGALAGSALVALYPGWMAVRNRPAQSLRAE